MKKLAFLLVMTTSCLGDCSAIKSDHRVGGGGVVNSPGGGAVGAGLGNLSLRSCTDYPPPGTPLVHYAARCETIYSDTSQVGTITDQTGNGRNATQATANFKPLFNDPCEASAINNLPCYDFDGLDDLADNAYAYDTEPFSVCFVLQSTATGVTTVIDRIGSGTGMNSFNVSFTGGKMQYYGWTTTFKSIDSAAGSSNANTFMSGCFSIDSVAGAKFKVDNTTETTDGAWTNSLHTGGTRFGGVRTGASSQLDLVEWATYDSVVEYATWEAYVESVYGALPQ